jgi:hypothetical protein
MKLYSIPRTLVFVISQEFIDIQYARIGSIWCEAFLDAGLAQYLMNKFPNQVLPYEAKIV